MARKVRAGCRRKVDRGDAPQCRSSSRASAAGWRASILRTGRRTPMWSVMSRTRHRLWPYADLPEQPTTEELAAIDPELQEALFGVERRRFSITLVFPSLDVPDFHRALEIAKGAAEYRETGSGAARRHRARFWPSDAAHLRDLFQIVGSSDATEVLIDDRPVPYARELWLPLVWCLLPR